MHDKLMSRRISIDVLPPAALPGAKLLKKFDQNFSLALRAFALMSFEG